MKMNEVKSKTWTKKAEIPIDGITSAILRGFGEMLFNEDVQAAITNGYIQVCDDGIIVWES